MGKTFLFTVWEGGGNVTPVVDAARRLVAAGHGVRFLAEDCNCGEVEAAGAEFLGWKRAPNRKVRDVASQACRDWEATTPQEGLIHVLRDLWCGPSLAYAEDVREELRRVGADLVVTSEMLFGVMAGCESVGQAFAVLSVNIRLPGLPGIPPMGPGLAPARTAEERALHAEIALGTQGLFDSGLPGLNAARGALGLAPLKHLMDQMDSAAVELLATSVAFDFPAESMPAHVKYVGPLISDPVWALEWRAPWDGEDERPLVAVGFSTTFQNHAGVLQKVIDALAPLPVRVLVTLGGSIDAGDLRGAGNTFIVESAPHTAVMKEARLVVTHGGHGTVMRALVNGVPMLVIPHGRDQNDNAVRVTERTAGLRLTAGASVEEIRGACERLLQEPAFLEGARRLGDRVAEEAEGCNVVEELVGAAGGGRCVAA